MVLELLWAMGRGQGRGWGWWTKGAGGGAGAVPVLPYLLLGVCSGGGTRGNST